jgi:flavin-dependent dehydrogenase
VLGGGPGGAGAALVLARAGIDVTLFVPSRPGEKPCGGAVPEFLLPRIPGFDASSLPAVAAPRAVLENGRGSSLDLDLGGVRIFRRGDLDPALRRAAAQAGAVVAARAEALELGRDSVVVRAGGENCRFDWVIGADGARGLSRRALGLAPEGESVGMGASLRGVEGERLVLSFAGEGDAYAWIFPRPGGVSVGVAFSPDTLRDGAARRQLDELLDRHLPAGWRAAPGPRYRYPIPVFGPWTSAAVARGLERRLLLVGDAAAMADPLTREGIRYAALSGMWAAEALAAGRPGGYLERLREAWVGEMERAARARRLFFEGPIGQWMVPVARHHAGVRGVLEELLACRLEYRDLRRSLLRAAFARRSAA